MTPNQFDWLKSHLHQLASDDQKRLQELGISKAVQAEKLKISITDFAKVMDEASEIVDKYMNN
ncbi:hypothetical protein [Terribacillus sp. DMT04]|uniref:hypothetical protein n=1 Tax=Terribacillus sp. DMT04 TaxID=2850441 RepID=UPI001C2BF84E|nr:hypothetical protein [Terribacillus sp. DMT04]QXE03558.1 hypothetical protein KS242_17950 [Terribacillus sp. DMT04]